MKAQRSIRFRMSKSTIMLKSIQPNCLILNHSRCRYVSDVPHLELSARMEFPTGADWPAVGGNTMQGTWFWRSTYPSAQLRSVDWIVNQNLMPDNKRNIVFQLNCAPNREGLMDDNVVARMAEVGKAWTSPPPLEQVPASWKNWPVPASLHFFSGKDLAQGKPVRLSADAKSKSGDALVDGNPNTSLDLNSSNEWLEIDLGKSYPLAGAHIWNRSPAHNVMLERGFLFVSETPFTSDDPSAIQTQANVKSIPITEAPGYPTPYAVGHVGAMCALSQRRVSRSDLAKWKSSSPKRSPGTATNVGHTRYGERIGHEADNQKGRCRFDGGVCAGLAAGRCHFRYSAQRAAFERGFSADTSDRIATGHGQPALRHVHLLESDIVIWIWKISSMLDHAPPRQGKDGVLGTSDDVSPSLMNPAKLDCGQWAEVAKSAG